MQRILIILLLEGYAILLAGMQGVAGVRTDEAKYLLNIPYPHPPFARWIIGQTEWMTYQEMFWRIVFATILVQAVWVIWSGSLCHELKWFDRAHHDTKSQLSQKIILGFSWLLSAALFMEGGKIMMAPLTAIQGLILVLFFLKDREASEAISSFWLGLLWLVSLFTAYQAVLFLPIVIAVFWRMRIPVFHKLVYVGGSLVLLAIYTLTNPLVIASMINAGGQQVSVSFVDRLGGVIDLWMIGGSVVVSILSVLGMIRAKSIPLIASLILVCAYIFFAHRAYYSVLFLPLLIGGMILFLEEHTLPLGRSVGLMAVMLLVFVQQYLFDGSQNITRDVLSKIPQEIRAGDILIAGPFGHQWQYASRVPLRRYRPELLSQAQAVVCLKSCEGFDESGWEKQEYADGILVFLPLPD